MAKSRDRAEPVQEPVQEPDVPTSTAVQDPPVPSSNVHDRVAQRAYELYLERGGADGGDFDDWLAAERELRRNVSAPPMEDTDE